MYVIICSFEKWNAANAPCDTSQSQANLVSSLFSCSNFKCSHSMWISPSITRLGLHSIQALVFFFFFICFIEGQPRLLHDLVRNSFRVSKESKPSSSISNQKTRSIIYHFIWSPNPLFFEISVNLLLFSHVTMANATKNLEFICQQFPPLLIPEEELKLVILFHFNFNFEQVSYFYNFL